MLKIMIFESHELPRDICFSVARELNLDIQYIQTNMKDVNDSFYEKYVREAEEKLMDAIVASYYLIEKLYAANPSLPVIPINFTNWQTLSIVYSLKKNIVDKHIPHPHKVALLTTEPLCLDLEMLEHIFDLELHNLLRPHNQSMPDEFFQTLKQEGFEIVACTDALHDQVIRAGMFHAFDPNSYSYNSVYEEFNRITTLLKISSQINRHNQELTQMMNYSFEAIWKTDPLGKITSYNLKAAALFSKSGFKNVSKNTSFSGYSVYDILSEKLHDIIDDALTNGTNYYNYLLLHSETDGIFNITPIMQNGAIHAVIFHFTALPHVEQMEEQIRSESYIKGHQAKYSFQNVIGDSEPIKQAIRQAERFAKFNSNILLTGETGTGKEIFAQSIHNASRRNTQPFVALNCGALPPTLLESELFGYVEGAFTGASKKGKKGLFEIADQGTIFLDEISEMDANGQLRLLRILEEKEVMRIGSDRVIPVNVRVIAACNKNLAELVAQGRFREDLFYRLNVLSIHIPPLHERGNDVFMLAEYYMDIYSQKYEKNVLLSPLCASVLRTFLWPGNVRQLRNFCERLVIIADEYQLTPEFVKDQLRQAYPFSSPAQEAHGSDKPEPSALMSEPEQIRLALHTAKGKRQKAAELLGISPSTLWRKMKKYDIF